jgi:AraC-like DNA-binding protein
VTADLVLRRPRRPELRRWVSAVWWCHGATTAETVLPGGRAHLVLRLDGDRPAEVLHGPASRPRLVAALPYGTFLGVVFRPGGLRAFLDVPADTLADDSVSTSEFDGFGARTRFEPEDGLDRMESALIARARTTDSAGLVTVVERGLRQGHSVANVAARVSMDRRALARLFRREVGFGLKRYARLARFERALWAVRAEDAAPLGIVAADLGFADQAHLTREFRHFAGCAPGRLHRVPGRTPWHVVQDETFKTGG